MNTVPSTVTSPPPPAPPRRRWGRRLLWGLLGLLGLVLVLVTGALIYITTPPGEERIRAMVVEQANKQLMGRLELGGLDLSLLSLKLTGVKLYDPEGAQVVEVGEVSARVDILPLLQKHVVVRDARLLQPHLSLHQDEKGLNLSRAIASRTPSTEPEKPKDTTPGTLRFDLEDFHLEGGAVAFVSESTDGTPPREVSLDGLNASATGSWASATEALAAQLNANAHMARPLDGPVHLALKAQGEKSKLGGSVDFGAPGLVLEASGGTEGEKQAHAEVQKLSLAPELGRALLPSYPVATKVGLAGTVVQAGNLVKLALNAQAAGGTAEANGAVDIEKYYTDGFTARVRGVDLAKLMGGGPKSSLSADLTVRGGGKSLETLVGTLDLTVPPSPISGQTLGPLEVHASAKKGEFTLSRLLAQAPGVEVEASGAGSLKDVRLQGRLKAPNLAAFADTVGRLGSGQPMPLSGKGDLHFTVQGAATHPAVTLDGGFDTLAWADTKLQGLWIELRLPDATRPLTSDDLIKVKRLQAGGQTYENLKASLTTQGREITASVSTTGRMDLSFALRALVDKDNEGLAIQDLSLHYPDDGWTMQAPTHVSWGNGRTVVEPILTLTSGPQQLALALKMEGQRIASTVDIKAFDLSRLPKPFLPESVKNLAGHMSGHVQVNGRLPRPDAQATLKLEGGRYDKYSNLGFNLDARYLRDRATGTFAAQAPAGRVSSKFDVPVQGLLKHRREPVDLELTVDRLDLGQAQRMAGQEEAVTGLVSGVMTLKGMANDPRLKLDLKGADLRYWAPGQPPPVVLAQGALPAHLQQQAEALGFALTAQSDDKDGTLSATLDLQGIAKKASAHLETPFTLGRLMAQPPSAQQMLNTPMRKLQAQVDDLSLALLSQFGMAEQASGTVSMKADLTGPMLSPVGELTLQARKATVNGIIPLDAEGQLVTSASAVKLQLSARHDNAPLAQMEAQINASLAALQDQDVVGRVPFTLAFKAGPISQRDLMGLAQAAPGSVSSMCGNTDFQLVQQATSGEPQNVLSMDLKARGTLDAPKVDLTAGVQNIGVSQVGLGQAQLKYTYDAAHSAFTVQLTAPNGGTMVAEGSLEQDLSLPTLRRGLNTDRAPVVVDVNAHNFDLAFLSGSQLPMVRSIGGELAMDQVHVDGTLGAPNLRGKIEWNKGKLALDGMGDYRDVHVALEVSDNSLSLSDFSAKSAGGKLQLKAQARRGNKGQYALSGEGTMDDFPLVVQDQLVAFMQMRTQFEGEVSENLVNIKNLTLSEMHVKLPDDKRKDLQSLDRPEGIVLLCQGKPLKPEKPAAEDAETGTGGAGPDKPSAQRRYWVNINAPRNLWVNGSDVNIEVGLGENFRVEYADAVAVTGQVNVMRGDVSVLGRRFTVQNNSQVRFTGPVATPYINATAEYDNEKAGVKVYVGVRGQGKDFSIKPTSDPPLPETDIYTLLATGRRTLTAGSGQSSMNSGQVASVLGSVLASQARKVLASKLPLDVLTIEAGDQGLQDAHLEVGKYLTDNLYLGYSGRLGTPQNQSTARRDNANAVRLEYQFSRRWGVQAEYGDAQKGGADVIWSKEY